MYELLIIKFATREVARSAIFLDYQIYGEPDAISRMDYFFWVARNEDRTIVIDSGFTKAVADRRKREILIEPAKALELLGISVTEATTLVLTHLHYDHVGNIELFANSPIVLSSREFEYWTGPYADRLPLAHVVEPDDVMYVSRAVKEGRVTLFRNEHEVAPGVRLIDIGGHTPGQSIVVVDTHDGPALVASDAVHYYEELDRDMPFALSANLIDVFSSFDLIRTWRDSGVINHVIAGHDPDTMRRFRADAHDVLPGLVAVIGKNE